MKCAPNRLFGVIEDHVNFNTSGIDGIMGMSRIIPGDNDARTQFIEGLVNASDPTLISNFTAFLDINNNVIHLGTPKKENYRNKSLSFLDFQV